MWSGEHVSAMADVVMAAVGVIGLAGIVVSWKQYRHLVGREIKYRTVEFYLAHRDRMRDLHAEIRKNVKLGDDEILSSTQAESIRDDDELKKKVQELLSEMELLGVSTKSEAMDFEFLMQLMRTNVLSYWATYYRYIALTEKVRNSSAYGSFADLAQAAYNAPKSSGENGVRFEALEEAVGKEKELLFSPSIGV